MGSALQTIEYSDSGGGIDQISSPTKMADDNATDSLNVDYSQDGSVFTRNGSSRLNSTQHNSGTRALGFFDYKNSDGVQTEIIANGTTIAHNLASPSNQITGLSPNLQIPDFQFFVTTDAEYVILGNSIDKNRKYNGISWTNLSIERAAGISGSVTAFTTGNLAAGNYTYYVSFARIVNGIIVQEGELSTSIIVTIAPGDANANILLTLPISSDSQVNARVLYRVNSGTAYRLTANATIENNTTTTYTDSITNANLSTTTANFNRQATPNSNVFEEFNGALYVKDSASPTDYLVSLANLPWNCPETSRVILDSEITCMKKIANILVIGTKNNIWTVNTSGTLRRISSRIGILNNRSLDGENLGYFISSTKKMYSLEAGQLNQDQIELNTPLSDWLKEEFNKIGGPGIDEVILKYYSKSNVAKVIIAIPSVSNLNNTVLIYNEQQSIRKTKPVWQKWNNLNIAALEVFKRNNNEIQLISGDYNGFYWFLDDPSLSGDGAQLNGTATSGSATVLNDTSQSLTTNAHIGMTIRFISGTGSGQVRTILSNTATSWTPTVNFNPNPDNTTVYTIGGYLHYHYTNWKFVLGSYKTLKQLWFFWPNMDVKGNYTVKGIIQKDFDETLANQTEMPMNLSSNTTIWNIGVWNSFTWGGKSVFENRFRVNLRFRSLRVGFYHDKAGQPWKFNGFAISAQDHGLLF